MQYATVFAAVTSDAALAERLDLDTARRFVLGKQFAFTCFDGSRGDARAFGDGSVMGTIQVRGSGPLHWVWLPAGTLKIKGEKYCASLSGIPIEPCFDLYRTNDKSFRGSLLGMDFAYCDFTHNIGSTWKQRPRSSEPLSLDPPRR